MSTTGGGTKDDGQMKNLQSLLQQQRTWQLSRLIVTRYFSEFGVELVYPKKTANGKKNKGALSDLIRRAGGLVDGDKCRWPEESTAQERLEDDDNEDKEDTSTAFERKDDDENEDEDEDEDDDISVVFEHGNGASNDKHARTFLDMTDARSTSAGSEYYALSNKGFPNEAGIIGVSEQKDPIFLNLHEPFCILATGLPGGGKSHTVNCILESCLLPKFNAKKPMSALVCHYDKNGGDNSVCESIGLVVRQEKFGEFLPTDNVVVLCSPTNIRKTESLYHRIDPKIVVKALRFRWDDLGARQIMKLMRLEDSARQLYVSVLFEKLRHYYEQGKMPSLEDFAVTACEGLDERQKCSAKQRLKILQAVVAREGQEYCDFDDLMRDGTMIIADLTDPFLSPSEANGVFQVLLAQFRTHSKQHGKVVVFDEAHRYMDSSDGLANDIIECARVMRHQGLRVVVSTQSPLVLPPELVNLSTVFVAHRIQSPAWFQFLCQQLPFAEKDFLTSRALRQGEALVYSTYTDFDYTVFKLQVRPRVTADYGETCRNVASTAGSLDGGAGKP